MAIGIEIKKSERVLFCGSKWWGDPDLPEQIEYPVLEVEEEGEKYSRKDRDSRHAVNAFDVFVSPILRDEDCRARADSEQYHCEKPAPLSCHSRSGKLNVSKLTNHQGVDKAEGCSQHILKRDGNCNGQSCVPESLVPKVQG